MTQIVLSDRLFEIIDVFGKKIRTTSSWWQQIVSEKHEEVRDKLEEVKETIKSSDEVRRSDKKEYIFLYYRRWSKHWMCVVVRHLNSDGFLMTAYITTKTKRKGVFVWQKEKVK